MTFSDSISFAGWRLHAADIPMLRKVARKVGNVRVSVRPTDNTGGVYREVSGEIRMHSWAASNERMAEFRCALIGAGISADCLRPTFGSGAL